MIDSFNHLLSLRISVRRRISIAIDVCCLCLTAYLAISISQYSLLDLSVINLFTILIVIVSTILLLILTKSYRGVIRHLDKNTLGSIALSIAGGAGLWVAIIWIFEFNRSNLTMLFLLQCFLALFLLIGYRSTLYWYISKHGKKKHETVSVAIYGVSPESRQFSASLSKSEKYKAAFFYTDDLSLDGGLIDGIRVYSAEHFDWALQRFKPSIFVFPQAVNDTSAHSEIIKKLVQSGIEVKLFDSVDASLGKIFQMEIARPIEIEDLLGRKEQSVDSRLSDEAVNGRHILVTGAAGSIGSQLCRRICEFKPASLSMMDIDESGLTAICEEVAFNGVTTKLYLGSIVDREFVDQMIKDSGADTIIHAAAYKHVVMGEACVRSVIKNNIQGTFNLVEAAKAAGIHRFIQISTDKAVEPSNVMGATKLWCEKLVSAFADGKKGQHFASVRFGNVIESRGSVIPKFKKQIASGGPVTITDLKMQRYFMSISEAVDLVVQATALAKGGEVFVLDMGKPHNILDVAKSVIQLAGKTLKSSERPQGDIEIVSIGAHASEKFEEKLFSNNEELIESDHPSIKISRSKTFSVEELMRMRDEILTTQKVPFEEELRAVLFEQIKKFDASETEKLNA